MNWEQTTQTISKVFEGGNFVLKMTYFTTGNSLAEGSCYLYTDSMDIIGSEYLETELDSFEQEAQEWADNAIHEQG